VSCLPISAERPLALGSASPRRRQILRDLQIPFLGAPAHIDESSLSEENPRSYVSRIASAKAKRVLHGLSELEDKGIRHSGLVLVADTIVVLDEQILGKPKNAEQAFRLVEQLVGRAHVVLTCYALGQHPSGELLVQRTIESQVVMREASPEELRRYAATGEGLDKAGAYAVQGLGAFLIREVRGSYSNVVGLPACEIVEDLLRLGALQSYPPSQPGGLVES